MVGRFCSVTRSVRGSAPDLLCCLSGFDCVASEYVATSGTVYAFGSAWAPAVSVSGVGECAFVREGTLLAYTDITQDLTSLTRRVNFSSRACASLPGSVNRSVSDFSMEEL